jgi:hypothetical protein
VDLQVDTTVSEERTASVLGREHGGGGGAQIWPLRSPDLTVLDFHEKNVLYQRKVNRREELHHRNFDAARHMNDPDVSGKVQTS